MRELLARLFGRRRPAARSAAEVALRVRVFGDAMRYAGYRERIAAQRIEVPLLRDDLIEIPPVLMIRMDPIDKEKEEQ